MSAVACTNGAPAIRTVAAGRRCVLPCHTLPTIPRARARRAPADQLDEELQKRIAREDELRDPSNFLE